MNELALFAGAGGGILGGKLLGWRTVCAVEIDEYCRHVLMSRQDDGSLPVFPIWDDIRTFDGRPWAGRVDVVTGGFPCQGISPLGKGAGLHDPRSGLWKEMARVVREAAPRYVFVENSPQLRSLGLGTVLGDLADMGYDARWGVFSACAVGASHVRKRMFILAYAHAAGLQEGGLRLGEAAAQSEAHDYRAGSRRATWQPEPSVGRVADGMAARVDRCAAIGNGQVPAVVRRAWLLLSSGIQ